MIYVDADACPVKEQVLKVATRRATPVTFVSNGGMRPNPNPLVTIVTVPKTPDAADDWIAERAGSGDIVVTADIPLAARSLEAGAAVLGPTGKPFDEASIGMALAMRHLKQQLREANQSQTYNAGFTNRDSSRFLQALDAAITRCAAL